MVLENKCAVRRQNAEHGAAQFAPQRQTWLSQPYQTFSSTLNRSKLHCTEFGQLTFGLTRYSALSDNSLIAVRQTLVLRVANEPRHQAILYVVGDEFMNTAFCGGLKTQSWNDLYQAAICESNLNNLPGRISPKDKAIKLIDVPKAFPTMSTVRIMSIGTHSFNAVNVGLQDPSNSGRASVNPFRSSSLAPQGL